WLFQRIPSQENIQAVTDGILWKLNIEVFQPLVHSRPGFSECGRIWLHTQLGFIKEMSLDLIREIATARHLKLLQEKPEIIQYEPLKQIASYLGVTDTSLSRIRKEISA